MALAAWKGVRLLEELVFVLSGVNCFSCAMAEFPWTWERLLWKESWADGGEKMNELEEVALRAGSLSQVFSLTAAKDLTGF